MTENHESTFQTDARKETVRNVLERISAGDLKRLRTERQQLATVFKIVGYAEQAAAYYHLEDIEAHVWIAHQRYPTKGRVWHPGGAHPFIGLNEALVHNGDFANHASISEYLSQRNIYPLFLTDTEVSVQVFDLLHRTYGYPLEYVIEALAPTTERDFTRLPADKQEVYALLQATHLHFVTSGFVGNTFDGWDRLLPDIDSAEPCFGGFEV